MNGSLCLKVSSPVRRSRTIFSFIFICRLRQFLIRFFDRLTLDLGTANQIAWFSNNDDGDLSMRVELDPANAKAGRGNTNCITCCSSFSTTMDIRRFIGGVCLVSFGFFSFLSLWRKEAVYFLCWLPPPLLPHPLLREGGISSRVCSLFCGKNGTVSSRPCPSLATPHYASLRRLKRTEVRDLLRFRVSLRFYGKNGTVSSVPFPCLVPRWLPPNMLPRAD